jgi:uncharacterized protein
MAYRAPAALQLQTAQFALRSLWQIGGLMLIGMGLFKLGVLSGDRPTRFYASIAALGFGIGVPVAWWGLQRGAAHGSDLAAFMLVDSQLAYWASLLVGVGWIGLVTLVGRIGGRFGPVAAVGRTALSNYLLQTVLCTTIFYGHGLGLFGRVDRSGQLLIGRPVIESPCRSSHALSAVSDRESREPPLLR